MFNDLDSTLKAILDDPAAPVDLRDADASFEAPDKNYRPSQATVNLFLYDVKENRTLRDPQPIFEVADGQYTRVLPPLRVDCSYLVTTWSNQEGAVKVAEEHKLLGQALAWLARFDTIPEDFFQGALVGQPYPPPTLVAQMEGKQNLSEFWTALGIPPRPAFTVAVTVAVGLKIEQAEGPEVVTHEVRLGERNGNQEAHYRIAGIVRVAGSATVIANTQVTLAELQRHTLTDDEGHFHFSGLAAGSYTLQGSATGFQEATAPITVPGATPHAYDLALTPAPPVSPLSSAQRSRSRTRSPKSKPGATTG